jgi:hypothetical protein
MVIDLLDHIAAKALAIALSAMSTSIGERCTSRIDDRHSTDALHQLIDNLIR